MKYVMKKILMMAATLIVVSLCVFLAFNIIPGDPATRLLGTNGTAAQLEALRQQMGLDKPLLSRYFSWLGGFLQGDLGTSYSYSIPVSGMILGKIPITLTMALMAFLIMIILTFSLGIYTAKHENGIADKTIMVINQIIMSIPPFFSGILLTYLFGMVLRLFTPGGFVSFDSDPVGFFGYLLLPSIAIALPKAAMAIKLFRGSLVGEVSKDYVRTAYSRGNSTTDVFKNHILKNAVIPVITFMGMALSDMIAGSLVIEQAFGIPGMSRILLTSISDRDYPVVEAIIMIIAIIVVVINLAVDVIYRIVDPRIEEL